MFLASFSDQNNYLNFSSLKEKKKKKRRENKWSWCEEIALLSKAPVIWEFYTFWFQFAVRPESWLITVRKVLPYAPRARFPVVATNFIIISAQFYFYFLFFHSFSVSATINHIINCANNWKLYLQPLHHDSTHKTVISTRSRRSPASVSPFVCTIADFLPARTLARL